MRLIVEEDKENFYLEIFLEEKELEDLLKGKIILNNCDEKIKKKEIGICVRKETYEKRK